MPLSSGLVKLKIDFDKYKIDADRYKNVLQKSLDSSNKRA
jgi:hypothetical protein